MLHQVAFHSIAIVCVCIHVHRNIHMHIQMHIHIHMRIHRITYNAHMSKLCMQSMSISAHYAIVDIELLSMTHTHSYEYTTIV